MSIPRFPSEIKAYKVSIMRTYAVIDLEGDEGLLGNFSFFFGDKEGGGIH